MKSAESGGLTVPAALRGLPILVGILAAVLAASVLQGTAAAGTHLAYASGTPSASATGGTPFTNQPVVQSLDPTNAVDTSDSTSVIQLCLTWTAGAGVTKDTCTPTATAGGVTATLTCDQTSDETTMKSGVATFSGCSIDKAGTWTLTASDQTPNKTSYLTAVHATVTVSPGPAAKFFLSGLIKANAGTQQTVTVTATDAGGNAPTTTYTGTVHLTSGDPKALLGADSPLTNNTGQFTVVLYTANPKQTVTATDTQTPSITGTEAVEVDPTNVTDHLILTDNTANGTPSNGKSTVAINTAVSYHAFSYDQYGNQNNFTNVCTTAPNNGPGEVTCNTVFQLYQDCTHLGQTCSLSLSFKGGNYWAEWGVGGTGEASDSDLDCDPTHSSTTQTTPGDNNCTTNIAGVKYIGANYNGRTCPNSPDSNIPSDCGVLTVTPGPPAQIGFTQVPEKTGCATPTGGLPFPCQPIVQVQDAAGNVESTDSADTITLTVAGGQAGATLTCAQNPLTMTGGVAAFSGCKIDKDSTASSSTGNYDLTATCSCKVQGQSGSLATTDTTGFAVVVGPWAGVTFVPQPGSATAGTALAGSNSTTASPTIPALALTDAGGNPEPTPRITTTTGTCTVTLQGGPAGTAFGKSTGGTASKTIGAQAKFTDSNGNTFWQCGSNSSGQFDELFVDAVNSSQKPYTILGSFTLNGVTMTTTSSTFNITPGAATELLFAQDPATPQAPLTSCTAPTGGTNFQCQPVVDVSDPFGNLVSTDNGTAISLSVSGGGRTNEALTCSQTNNTANDSGGVATFSGCSINLASVSGHAYNLVAQEASGTLKNGTSAPFNVLVGPATKLAFSGNWNVPTAGSWPNACLEATQGSTGDDIGTGGLPFLCTPAVAVEDAGGNVTLDATTVVQLAISTNANNNSARLTGCPATVDTTQTPNVTNLNSTQASSGLATFTGCGIDRAGTEYQITASDITPGRATKLAPTPQSHAFSVEVGPAAKLAVVPSGTPCTTSAAGAEQCTAGQAFTVTVSLSDAGGNLVSPQGSADKLALKVTGTTTNGTNTAPLWDSSATTTCANTNTGTPASNTLNAGSPDATASGDQWTFSSSSANGTPEIKCTSNTPYTLTATLTPGAGSPVTSCANTPALCSGTLPLTITPGAPSAAAFVASPGTTACGTALGGGHLTGGTSWISACEPQVQVTDSLGNPEFNDNGGHKVTLAITANTGPPATATRQPTLKCANNTVADSGAGGEAVFANCNIDVATFDYTGKQITGDTQYTLTATVPVTGSNTPITASSTCAGSASCPFDIYTGPAAELMFTQDPSGATCQNTAGAAFVATCQPVVGVADLGNNPTPDAAGGPTSVKLGVAPPNPSEAAVINCASNPASVAAGPPATLTFSGCAVNHSGSFMLSATDVTAGRTALLNSGISKSFTIGPASAFALAFTVEPATSTAGSQVQGAGGGTLTVCVVDAFGDVVTSNSGHAITLSATDTATNSGAAVDAASVNPVSDAAGCSGFGNFSVDKSGPIQLTASTSDATTCTPNTSCQAGKSSTFTNVAAVATQLAFLQDPATPGPSTVYCPNGTNSGTNPSGHTPQTLNTGGVAFPCQPQVVLEDAHKNPTATDAAGGPTTVQLSLSTVTNGATLTCTDPTTGHTTATPSLKIGTQSLAVAGDPAVNVGLADFSNPSFNCSVNLVNTASQPNYTLSAADITSGRTPALTGGTSNTFQITQGPAVQLSFSQGPWEPDPGTGQNCARAATETSQAGDHTWGCQPVVNAVDAGGNPTTQGIGNGEVTLTLNPPDAGSTPAYLPVIPDATNSRPYTALSQLWCAQTAHGVTQLALSAGVATFSNCSVNSEGNNYTLTATAGTLSSPAVAAQKFNVTGGTATQLWALQEPTRPEAGTSTTCPKQIGSDAATDTLQDQSGVAFPCQFIVEAADAGGNPDPNENSQIDQAQGTHAAEISQTQGLDGSTGVQNSVIKCSNSYPINGSTTPTAGVAPFKNGIATFTGCYIDKSNRAWDSLLIADGGNPATQINPPNPDGSCPQIENAQFNGSIPLSNSSGTVVACTIYGYRVLIADPYAPGNNGTNQGLNAYARFESQPFDNWPGPESSLTWIQSPGTPPVIAPLGTLCPYKSRTPAGSLANLGGTPFDCQPVAALSDAFGNPTPGPTASVSLGLLHGASGASLRCDSNNTATTDSLGFAYFSGCRIDLKASNNVIGAVATQNGNTLPCTAGTGTGTNGTQAPCSGSSFSVQAGPAVALNVTGLSAQAAGTAQQATINAVDAGGNVDPAWQGTVHLTSTDSKAQLGSDATLPNGAGSFSVTFETAGQQTLTATCNAACSDANPAPVPAPAPPTGAETATVNPGPPDVLTIGTNPSGQTTMPAGVNVTFAASGTDLYGNPTGDISSTTLFTIAPDGQCSTASGATNTPGDNLCQASVLGNHTITAHNNNKTAGITLKVVPGPASTFVFSGLVDATAGTAQSVTVTAQDQFGNVANTYLGTVRFTSSDSHATLPANYTFTSGDAGSHLFSSAVTLVTAGSQTLSATDTSATGTPATGTSSPVTISAGPAAKLSIVANGAMSAGQTQGFTVTVVDQYGNSVPGAAGSSTLAITPLSAGDQASCSGTSCSATQAGVHTVTATSTAQCGASPCTGTTTVNVLPGPETKLVFTQQPGGALANAALSPQPKVTIEDAYNNIETQDVTTSITLAITPGTGAAGATLTCPGTQSNNAVTVSAGVASWSGCSINQIANGYRLRAAATSVASSDSSLFNIVAGAADAAHSSLIINKAAPYNGQSGAYQVIAGLQLPLIATIKDSSGNPIAGDAVSFAAGPYTTSCNASPFATVNTSASGTATATWTAGTSHGLYCLTASVSSGGGTLTLTAPQNVYVFYSWTMDAFGHIDAIGASPVATTSATFTQQLARKLLVASDDSHGYVVDVYGIVHPFCLGSGCTMPATPQLQDRWDPGSTDGGPGGFKIVRSAALTSDGNGGYVLDGYGGVHPFGSALSRGLPRLSDYWGAVRNGGDPNAPNFDIARSIALISDTDGLVLDGYGGIHEFSYASGFQAYQIGKVNGLLSDYWGAVGNGGEPTASNFDIAHDLAIVPGTNEGYVMDGYGGMHPFRYSTSESFPAYFSANNQTGTLPLSDYWGCTCYGGDPNASNYDISRGIALTGDSTLQQPEVLLLDGLGGVHADPQTFWSGQDAAYHQNLDVFKSIVVQ